MAHKHSENSLRKQVLVFLNSIKTKLVLSFLLITLTPLVYIGYTMLNSASDGLLNVIVSNSLAHARKASIDFNRFINQHQEIATTLKTSSEAVNKDYKSLSQLFHQIDERHFSIEKIYALDVNNNVIASSASHDFKVAFNINNLEERLANDKCLLLSQSGVSRSVAIASQLVDEQKNRYGVLIIELNMFALTRALSENLAGSSTRGYLLNENKLAVAMYPDSAVEDDLLYMKSHIGGSDYGVFSIEGPDLNKSMLSAYLPIVGLGWKVLLIQDQQEVYALVDGFQRNLYTILFLTIFVAVTIALMISQNIALPILQLTKGANELASGNYTARINVKNTDEVGQLASNFNFMADSLARKIEELRTAYDELQKRSDEIEKTNVDLDRKVFEVSLLYKIGRVMGEIGIDLDRLLDVIIDKAIEAADAERGSLMLFDEDQEALELQRVRVWDAEKAQVIPIYDFKRNINIKPGEGIAGKVLQTGEMLIINDPDAHPDFKQYDDESVRVRQLCCIPLTAKQITFGVINIVNRRDGRGFDQRDSGLLEAMANQAALALDNTKLFKLAITDGLTGLYMVRHFNIKLEEEIKRSSRYNKIFSVLFVDIDYFKKFNDTYGHHVGDEVLIWVAKIFKNSLRDGIDMAARYGGEEMIALLPETNAEGAYVVAERLRHSIESYEFAGYETPLHVTISIGIAQFPLHDKNSIELIKKADTALYFSKERGRNQTSVYSDEMGVASEK